LRQFVDHRFDRSLQSIVAEFWALRGAFLLLGRGRLSVLRPNFIAEHARMLEPAGLPGISFGRKQPKLAIVKVLPYATIMGHGMPSFFVKPYPSP
jgi:hypothetical protein